MGNSAFDNCNSNTVYPASKQKSGINEEDAGYTAQDERDKGKVQKQKDPQKMQKEMTELYKKHKVNPLGGCLPMLLQIPVFFALYTILSVAIELRGAPFILWITDLSGPDTLFRHIPSWFPLIGGFAVGPCRLPWGLQWSSSRR